MNFSDVLKALNQASAFELFRMRAAINRVLDQPQWVDAVRGRLRVGQVVEYFDSQANAACQATIIELRRKQALVLDIATQTRWLISYASINLDGADVQIREQVRRGLGRNEVAVGEVLGFLDREQRERSGKVVRLNDKTVTLLCGGLRWRVPYVLLHRVVDARAIEGEVLEIGV
ncbi:hypothetical protein, partial [Accumulibacter sp.]|uniref:hypothetical protein n=1 Tax=Accumulibacter sp. TaxID=2053492 RepID=UPI002D1FA04B